MTAAPTRAAGVVFALLVAATIGAFFLAQRVKSTPATVTRFSVTPFCSPNGDGRFDGCRAAFLLKKADEITVSVVGADGDVVDEVVSDRSVPAYRNIRVLWRGTSDEGGRAPDGAYRFRVTLRDQGRSITLPRAFDLDTTPPRRTSPRSTARRSRGRARRTRSSARASAWSRSPTSASPRPTRATGR